MNPTVLLGVSCICLAAAVALLNVLVKSLDKRVRLLEERSLPETLAEAVGRRSL